ncbi:MAG: rRNA maturation RNase YbeY [Myxococcota bacterium]
MKVRLQVSASVRRSVPGGIRRALTRRLASAARRVGVDPEQHVTVRLTDDEEIARLHVDFMGLPGPTDVLSFPSEAPELDVDEMAADPSVIGPADDSLGDIVIAWPFAVRQSAPRGAGPAAWQAEVVDLALHGLAHLLGHDHGERAQARAMLRLEQRLARGAQMPAPQRPYR